MKQKKIRKSLDSQHNLAKLTFRYQAACRRFDIEAAVACFAPDGRLEYAGHVYTGTAELRNAHLWDRGAHNEIAFIDLSVVRNVVHCTMLNQHELHRVLGIDSIRRPAKFIVRKSSITSLQILTPDSKSMQAFRQMAAPFFAWVRAHQAEAWERTEILDEEGGRTLYELAHAWQDAKLGAGP